MRLIYLCCFMLILILVYPVVCLKASDKKAPDAVIIYTGDIRGNVVPKGCCSKTGGIAHRIKKINELKDEFDSTIVIDLGDMVTSEKNDDLIGLKIKYTGIGLRLIQYDVLNIADGEIVMGDHFINKLMPEFPYISLNVSLIDQKANQIPPYVIKPAGKIKIAFIGLTSSHFLMDNLPDKVKVIDPFSRLRMYLPEIKRQSDVIVLLSHLGWALSKKLVNEIPGINIVIVGHDTYPTFEPEKIEDTYLVKNDIGGGFLGIIKLWTDDSRKLKKVTNAFEVLGMDFTPDTEHEMIEKRFAAEKNQIISNRTMTKERLEILQLTPEEFIEQFKKNNFKHFY